MTKKLDSTRYLVNEIYAFPFPLSQRHGDMFFQIFNNIEEDGTIQFQIRSYDSTDKPEGKNFWLPKHIQKEGDLYLREQKKGKKRSLVKIDADILVGQFKLEDDSTVTLRAASHFCPRFNLTIPQPFQEYFGRSFSVGWADRMS